MKDRSDHNCLKNYTRLRVFSWICLELMAQTNQIGTGTRVCKMMVYQRIAMTRNRLLGDTLLHDMYEGAKQAAYVAGCH